MVRQVMRIRYIFLPFICFIDITYQQTIHIEVNTNYSAIAEKKCKPTLLHDKDCVLYRSQINISGLIDTLDFVEYELKSPGQDFEPICHLNLRRCFGFMRANCYCLPAEDTNVFNVVINITALAHNSEAILRGRLAFHSGDVYSNEQKLPFIYEPVGEEAFIYINNERMDVTQCSSKLNDSHVVILFLVSHNLNLSCQLRIEDKQTGLSVVRNTTILSYTTRQRGKQLFMLTYKFCGIAQLNHNFTCSIETDNVNSNDEILQIKTNHLSNFQILFACSTTLLVIVCTLILVYVIKAKIFKRRSNMFQEIQHRPTALTLNLSEPLKEKSINFSILDEAHSLTGATSSAMQKLMEDPIETNAYGNGQVAKEDQGKYPMPLTTFQTLNPVPSNDAADESVLPVQIKSNFR